MTIDWGPPDAATQGIDYFGLILMDKDQVWYKVLSTDMPPLADVPDERSFAPICALLRTYSSSTGRYQFKSFAPVLPEVPEDQKFDGGIHIAWKPIERKIKVALQNQGLDGYIDGKVKEPTASESTDSLKVSKGTPVFSEKPTFPEWRFRNNQTKGIIESFILDLPFMNAKTLFDTLVAEFGQKDNMRKTLSMRRLRSHIFREDKMIDTFFKTLRDLRRDVIDMGNDIPGSVFHKIVLTAFPIVTFDTIMQNINANPLIFAMSTAVIQQIAFQYSQSVNQLDAVIPGDHLPQANSVLDLASQIKSIEKHVHPPVE
ncbi:hypothetical protein EV361DRAFT_874459 [Lentinula raphanica]|uniref:Uncharacterized protein n=1 Tax=Lentinula raphanica TaxID=153919 RepID=A0AA38UAU0_9AGAR|nr:hypothetical protein F5878DRAFT_647015 [Lentinula raphanica]KAJ3963897.1 hypothetical protein EV361DRAFT_874459 [Lentinula raphanica]